MIRWLEKNGYNMTYVAQPDIDSEPGAPEEPQSLHLQRPRRVLVRRRTRGGRIGARSRRQPRLLQRQRDLLEDPLGTEHRRLEHARPHAHHLQGDALQRTGRPGRAERRHLDLAATRASATGGAGRPDEQPQRSATSWSTPAPPTSRSRAPSPNCASGSNTTVVELSPSQTLTLSPGHRHARLRVGRRRRQRLPAAGPDLALLDHGQRGAKPSPTTAPTSKNNGIATHSLSLYRAPSGALVFGAGTVQWSWGLDNTNAWDGGSTDPSENPPDPNMEQATVNLLAEMGAQPGTLQSGLVAGDRIDRHTPPTATITSPTAGKPLKSGEMVTITGTAADTGGGVVAGVEVSTDGGKTWHPATGTSSWTYAWNVDGAELDHDRGAGDRRLRQHRRAERRRDRLGRLPVLDAGDRTPDHRRRRRQRLDLGSGSSSAATSPARSTASASSNRPPTPAPTSAASGPSAATLLAEATFSGETADRLAAGRIRHAGRDPGRTRPTSPAYFAPNGHYSDTSWQLNEPPATGPPSSNHGPLHILPDVETATASTPTAATAPSRPTPTTPTTTGSTSSSRRRRCRARPARRLGQRRARPGDGQLDRRRPAAAPRPATRSPPTSAPTAETPVTVPAPATSKVAHRADRRHHLHLRRHRHQRSRRRAGLGPLQRGHADRGDRARGADRRRATAGADLGDGHLDRPGERRRQPDHRLPGDPLRRRQSRRPRSTAGASATSATVNGLTAGTTYTFTVAATNAVGTGPDRRSRTRWSRPRPAGPGAPTGVTAPAKSSGAARQLDRSDERRRQRDHRLPGHPVHRRHRRRRATTTGAAATAATVTGPHQRHRLHLQGRGDQRARHRRRIGGLELGHPLRHDLRPRHAGARSTPATAARSSSGSSSAATSPARSTASASTKPPTNTGTHVGSLWTASGQLLAASDLHQRDRLRLAAGDVRHAGRDRSRTRPTSPATWRRTATTRSTARTSKPRSTTGRCTPKRQLGTSGTEGNGVYAYGSGITFPTSTYNASNYWVDVLFTPEPPADVPGAPATGVTATAGLGSATVNWTAPTSGGNPTSYTVTPLHRRRRADGERENGHRQPAGDLERRSAG